VRQLRKAIQALPSWDLRQTINKKRNVFAGRIIRADQGVVLPKISNRENFIAQWSAKK
jgi:aconitase B